MESEDLKQRVINWWNENPFNYNISEDEGSWQYFRNIDRKFLKWHPWGQSGYPLLSNFIDYRNLRGKKVLDIGCGPGWSSEQFAQMGCDVTAIDITPKAIELTKKKV